MSRPEVFDDPLRKLLPMKQEKSFPLQVLPQRVLASDVAGCCGWSSCPIV